MTRLEHEAATLAATPFQDLLNRMMETPSLDKLQSFATDFKAAQAEELAAYKADLAALDWQLEFIDDSRLRNRKREVLNRIRAMQPIVDPGAVLFNAARPGRHGDVTLWGAA